jgi:PAS domain S-box-containing protein
MINLPTETSNIISVLPLPVAVVDKDLHFVAFSRKWVSLYTHTNSIPGESLFTVFPGLSATDRAVFYSVLEQGEDPERSGSFCMVDCRSWELQRWFTSEGRVGGLIIYPQAVIGGSDISAAETTFRSHVDSAFGDRKENEEPASGISFNEQQFKQAFEHSMIGMALIDTNGKWARVNKSLCEMFGYTQEELQSMYVKDVTHPDDLEVSSYLLDSLNGGVSESVKVEKRYIRKDGEVIWVIIATSILRNASGSPLHYVAQIENITQRKVIEADLLLSEKKYRTIFENVQDVFYLTSPEGLVTEISPSIKLYSGFSREEVIGRPVTDFYYYLQDRKKILETLRSKGSVIDFEVRLKTRDNKLKYASVNARVVTEAGVVVAIEGSMRDVTTRKFHENALKALNSQLTASNNQKDKLLSIIGHDLRNPISGSLQLLDLTLMDFESATATELHTYLSKMKSELSNANELLEDLLSWAKAQFNAVSFNPVEIEDIAAQVDKCVHNILPMAINKGVEINQYYEEALKLTGDKGMLETIIRNLVSNAVKFSVKGGKIDVRVVSYEGGVQFSVSDNGTGIPQDILPQLFDKTSNYTTYGTLGEKGTGLGLNLCFDFVEKHGGSLWVESTAGLGSTFYFTIPGK